jgi:hypothetical protein
MVALMLIRNALLTHDQLHYTPVSQYKPQCIKFQGIDEAYFRIICTGPDEDPHELKN